MTRRASSATLPGLVTQLRAIAGRTQGVDDHTVIHLAADALLVAAERERVLREALENLTVAISIAGSAAATALIKKASAEAHLNQMWHAARAALGQASSSAQDAMLDDATAALSILPPAKAARITELERQRAALVAFAKHCIQATELDGADVQDLAVKHGLLVETQYAPAIHGPNDCDVEAGDSWFVFADWLKP